MYAVAAFFVNTVVCAAQIFSTSFYNKTPYHTSALSSHAWVQELINGHPERIKCELGMSLFVFQALIKALRTVGLQDTRSITLKEYLAIFLYTCVTGLSIWHVGERFQHANATISKYVLHIYRREISHYELLFRAFCMILYGLSSPPSHTTYVHLLTIHDAVPSKILSNPKFFPFFEGAIGAMDGTHINCCPSSEEQHLVHDRKGEVSQNTLACCSFDMQFQYVMSGWDRCAADASMYNDA